MAMMLTSERVDDFTTLLFAKFDWVGRAVLADQAPIRCLGCSDPEDRADRGDPFPFVGFIYDIL